MSFAPLTIGAQLSEALAPWLPPLFAQPVPPERRATCDRCAMCKPADAREAAARSGGFFSPDTKCCSYNPTLPNFVVGALLADTRPELAEGRARIRARIAGQHGVSPAGVEGPPLYWMKFNAVGFGRAEGLLCPYFQDGRCSIWQLRTAVCSTYFCKHVGGEDGRAFWDAVRDYLIELSAAMSVHAMLALGVKARRALAPKAVLTPEELDGLPLPADEYDDRWGAYATREEAFFLAAHHRVQLLDSAAANALGGSRLAAHLQDLGVRYQQLTAPDMPATLRLNPKLVVLPNRHEGYILEAYSASDRSHVSPVVFRALEQFDGRPTAAVVRSLREQGQAYPSASLIQSLYQHRVLVPE